jgi:phospholipid/cholesterol/gamma-HCH transport system substrate-binding protein
MTNKETVHTIKLGFFVVAGLLLLVVGLYFIGSNRNIFGKSITLFSNFTNVEGLQIGNNVRYAGIDVGTVEKIEIINDTTIRVQMSLKQDLKNNIRKNSRASVGTDGLMGNKLINIDPGSPDQPLVETGDILGGTLPVNTQNMLRTLEFTNDNISVISSNLKNITNNIGKSKGTLYKLLLDTTLSERLYHAINNIEIVGNNLNAITSDLSDITTDMKQGKGVFGTLLNDTSMASDLREALKQVKESGEKINSTAGELKASLQKINNGNGTAGMLLNDTAAANQIKRSIVNIENSTRNFNDNMEGLKQSFLLRGYFRRQAKKSEAGQKQ